MVCLDKYTVEQKSAKTNAMCENTISSARQDCGERYEGLCKPLQKLADEVLAWDKVLNTVMTKDDDTDADLADETTNTINQRLKTT